MTWLISGREETRRGDDEVEEILDPANLKVSLRVGSSWCRFEYSDDGDGVGVSRVEGTGSGSRDGRWRIRYLVPRLGSCDDDEERLEVSLVAKGPPGLIKGETMGVGTLEGGFPSSHGSRDRREDSGDIMVLRDGAVLLLADELNVLCVACLLGAVLKEDDLSDSFVEG